MRYDKDAKGYIKNCYWGCYTGTCVEYTGTVPTGYSSLENWADSVILNAWYINSSGNLALDSAREAELRAKQEQETVDYTPIVYKDLCQSIEGLAGQNVEARVIGKCAEITDGTKSMPYIELHNISGANGRIDLFSQGRQMLRDDSVSQTINGVTFLSVGGEITIRGIASEAFEYTISGSADNTEPICGIRKLNYHYLDVGSLQCELRNYDGDSTSIVYSGTSGILRFNEYNNVTHAVLLIPKGYINKTVKPMLNFGFSRADWEEYNSSHISMTYEYSSDLLYPSNSLYPAADLYPVDDGYIVINGVIQTFVENESARVIGSGNVNIIPDYNYIYTTQGVVLDIKYKTTTLYGTFNGSHRGEAGGLDISANSIYSGDESGSSAGDFRLSSVDFERTINDVSRDGLRFAIGNKFGVKNDGTVYAVNADLAGKITSDTGKIGNLNINDGGLYYGTTSIESDTDGIYVGYNGIRKIADGGDGSRWESTIKSGKIYTQLFNSNSTTLWTVLCGEGIYFGNSGRAAKDAAFKSSISPNGSSLTIYSKGNVSLIPDGYIYAGATLRPESDNTYYLGASSTRWKKIYAADGTIGTSDRRLKEEIKPISQKYVDMFDDLMPVSYRFKGEEETHTGFVAQDVEAAMDKHGLKYNDLFALQKDLITEEGATLPKGESMYSLCYDEFIAIMAAKVKQLEEEIKTLKEELHELHKNKLG